MAKARSILIYGRTNSGKTAQVGELAEMVYLTSGKKTRLYTCDRGGTDTIQPLIDLGIIEVIEQGDSEPFIFLHQAVRGKVRDANGKWVDGDLTNIGLVAFESLTAFADAVMADMAKLAGDGVNIGGGGNVSFTVKGDGETLKVGGSNMAMYGVAQTRVTEEVWTSQKLPTDYVMWTASASRDEDPNATGKLLGPAVAGKALTGEVPRWFNLTFRIDAIPQGGGKPERHVLYLGNSLDASAGNATSLGNTRTPLGATPLPTSVEPASITKALELIDHAKKEALEKKRQKFAAVTGK